MKKGLVTVFILILFAGFVSAGTCDDSQVIMKLFNSTNAHGALYSDTNYNYDVCSNEIFGSTYSGVDPHDCTGINRILSLSSITNAHASSENDLIYANDVCYGELRCEYDNNNTDNVCDNGGEVVVRMSSLSNAHISSADDMNYPIRVCCTDMPSIYWADMNGDEIVSADFGDTVRMVATGYSGAFDIFEDDLINNDEIRTGIASEVLGSRIIGTWTITQEDLDKTNDFDGFKFTINGNKSEDLKVNTKRDDDPMNITVLSPKCGEYFNGSSTIEIEIEDSDLDDEIFGTVSINGTNIEKFGNGGGSFRYTFTDGEIGNFQIKVEANNTKSKRSRAISNIMILDKDGTGYVPNKNYTAACISKPEDFSNIEGSDVWFDASTTRAIIIDSAGYLDELVPNEGDIFSWYWEFTDSALNSQTYISESTTEADAYRFWWPFPSVGHNLARLRVEIN